MNGCNEKEMTYLYASGFRLRVAPPFTVHTLMADGSFQLVSFAKIDAKQQQSNIVAS
jgi:hypothetical protein